ncbi:unnamed protein product [Cuscuta campestris]|nr:unnamed protein product [Cuscuta campestris]
MECALRSCIVPETTHHQPEGEFAAVGSGGDDFSVDDLLDLSNGFSEECEEKEKTEVEIPLEKSVFSALGVKQEIREEPVAPVAFSSMGDFSCLPGGDLISPAADLDNLEWLSHFEEDSLPGYSLTGKLPPAPSGGKNRRQTEIPVREKPPVQTKARSKRARTGVRVWLSGSQSLTESSTESSSTMSSSPPHPYFAHPNPGRASERLVGIPPAKKQRKKAPPPPPGALQPRRCNHCGVQKTPQWRAGPLGAKTLCNACGVRYKSGRLLPEYRPACSPTFSSQLHSNNHRKVMEMRRKKESETDPGLVQPVQSF